jgi:protein-disulfide isomerase
MPEILPGRRLLASALVVLVMAASAAAWAARPRPAAPKPPPPETLPGDMTLGNPAAKVTVVEYASVGCPICAEWGRTVYPAFKAKYVDRGRVHFVYREMLVGGGVEITTAAAGFVLARCAGPSKYFDVVEAVYRDQEAVFRTPRPALMAIAKGAGLSEAQFTACLSNEAAFAELYKRTEANARTGKVNATPTFVINGKALEPGAQPLAALDAAIAHAASGN